MNLSDSPVEEYEQRHDRNAAGAGNAQSGPAVYAYLSGEEQTSADERMASLCTYRLPTPLSCKSGESKHPCCVWGAAITTDTMIIDCDSDAAVSALCDLGEMPPTLTTLTPRGFHFWFRVPKAVTVRNRVGVMPGIDVRTKGGFVVVPPSDGYAFADLSAPVADAPDWILRLVVGEGTLSLPPEPVQHKEPKPVHEKSTRTPFEKDVADRVWEKRVDPGKSS